MRDKRWSEEWWINNVLGALLALFVVFAGVGVASLNPTMAAVFTGLTLLEVGAIAYAHARRRWNLERDIRADLR